MWFCVKVNKSLKITFSWQRRLVQVVKCNFDENNYIYELINENLKKKTLSCRKTSLIFIINICLMATPHDIFRVIKWTFCYIVV